jgi:putative spermidine/putrescine transport system substrate-binding protein
VFLLRLADVAGSMGSAMRKAFINTFEKKYGIRVIETSAVELRPGRSGMSLGP